MAFFTVLPANLILLLLSLLGTHRRKCTHLISLNASSRICIEKIIKKDRVKKQIALDKKALYIGIR